MDQFEWLLELQFIKLMDLTNYDELRDKGQFVQLEDFLEEKLLDKAGKKILFFLVLPDEKKKNVNNLYLGYNPEYVVDVNTVVNNVVTIMKRLEII